MRRSWALVCLVGVMVLVVGGMPSARLRAARRVGAMWGATLDPCLPRAAAIDDDDDRDPDATPRGDSLDAVTCTSPSWVPPLRCLALVQAIVSPVRAGPRSPLALAPKTSPPRSSLSSI